MIEQDKVAMKENGSWSSTLWDIAVKKMDPSYFLEFEKKLNKLTVKDIQATAKLLLDGKNQFTAVLMPETVVKEGGEKKKAF